ncbi:MAG: PP2C family serine/threonine-protein phosphatase [Cyanobacteriota bacterium]|nr:PP2C family serine/threonine-protein phosphatase [Cyanobacteriota bacterium]
MPEDAVSTESLTASSENRSEDTAEIDRADDIPSESQDGQKEGSDGESGNELKKERISLPPLGKTELPESNPVDILTGVVKSDPPDSAGSNSPIRLLLADALESARQAVEAAAEERHVAVRELASTLIAIVATPDWVAAAQVGDGAAVVCDVENQILPLTIPKSGEYINETTFLISPNARASAQFHLWQGTPMQIAMFSDGLQLLALDMPAGTPHAPFFAPLFRFVAQDNLSDDRAKEELENFLTSDRVTQRADDDLTLVLATFNGSGRERGTGNGEREED